MSDISLQEKEKEFYKKLGIALRQARRAANKSQSDVAKSIDVTFQQIQKYEKATNYPKEFKTREIVKYLGRSDYDGFLRDYNVHTH
jgi:transcriptional regulator with XRE-family HTH domain|tara:strand:- start:649 stop:906 length:258 start_codon:yes stop_codon:yes gene_type:complete